MQIYADLRILSARPSEEEEQLAPHKLYGIYDGAQICSAVQWAELAAEEISKARAANKLPIIVGGTGMYIKTLRYGIAQVPEIPVKIREQLREQLSEMGNEKFHLWLSERDPISAAKLFPGDSSRLLRAAEVWQATGICLSEWQKTNSTPPFPPEIYKIYALDMARELLYKRINLRFEQMLEQGALEEVEKLMQRKLANNLPIMRTLGVPELMRYLNKETSLDEAIEKAQTNSRHYAKRQLTWLRHQMTDTIWCQSNNINE